MSDKGGGGFGGLIREPADQESRSADSWAKSTLTKVRARRRMMRQQRRAKFLKELERARRGKKQELDDISRHIHGGFYTG